MGLSVSHGCFRGPYSEFSRWRIELARAAGLPPLELMEGYFCNDDDKAVFLLTNPFWRLREDKSVKPILDRLPIKWNSLKKDSILHNFLLHSDCDGYINISQLEKLAIRLKELLPNINEEWLHTTTQFIEGLLRAKKLGERVKFG